MFSRSIRHFYQAAVTCNSLCASHQTSVLLNVQLRNLAILSFRPTNCTSPLQPSLSLCLSHSVSTSSQTEPKNVIYLGSMTTKVYRVKLLSFTSSLMGVILQPIIYKEATSLPTLIAFSSFIGFFTFVTPLLLHFVTKRYVTRILYNKEKDEYVAELITFFLRKKQVSFKPGEAIIPDMGGMLTSMEVRGIPMIVDFGNFHSDHCKHMLGYDKPLDIKHDSIAEDLSHIQSEKQQK